MDFTVLIFSLTKNNNINRNIMSQLERATISITNNIAEGFKLQSNKQLVKFLFIAKGSSGECRNLLTMANRLKQIDDQNFEVLKNKSLEIYKQLANFSNYLKKSNID